MKLVIQSFLCHTHYKNVFIYDFNILNLFYIKTFVTLIKFTNK
jgi:hypothetical protein